MSIQKIHFRILLTADMLPFLKTAEFKKGLISTDILVPNKKLMNIVNEQFAIRSKLNNMPPEQQQI